MNPSVLRSERIAGDILPRVLNTFDMIAIFVAIVLFISMLVSETRPPHIMVGVVGPSSMANSLPTSRCLAGMLQVGFPRSRAQRGARTAFRGLPSGSAHRRQP